MQAPLTDNGIKIPLTELLSILQNDGFEISTRTVLDIQKVLANLDDISKENTAHLKLLLGPLICRNKEEQERFYKLFDDYEGQLNEHSGQILDQFKKEKQAAIEKEEQERIQQQNRKKKRRRIRIILIALSIPVLLAAGYFIYKYILPPRIKPTIAFLTPTIPNLSYTADTVLAKQMLENYSDQDIVINKSKNFEVYLDDTTAGHSYDVLWKIDDSIYHHHRSLRKTFYHPGSYAIKVFLLEHNKIIDSTVNVAQVLCEPRPFLFLLNDSLQQQDGNKKIYHARLLDYWHEKNYKYNWFVDDNLRHTGPDFEYGEHDLKSHTITVKAEGNINPSCESSIYQVNTMEFPKLELKVAGTKPLQLNRELNNRFLRSFLIICLFGSIYIYSLFYEKRLKKLKAKFFTDDPKTPVEKKQPAEFSGPYSINFKPQEVKIAHESAISQLAETLRKRHTTDTYYLNINKTIRNSIKKAGFPVFEFSARTQPTDFLVFVDKEYPDSHLVKLYNYVLACLKNEQVNFTAYSYAHEPLLLSNESLNQLLLPIDKVARLYPGTILFLFADTETFFRPLDNKLQSWATEKFKSWDSKIIFTSIAKKDWGSREMILYNAGFTVVPADINAHKIITDEINYMIDRNRLKKTIIPGAYAAQHVNFNEWNGLKLYLQDAVYENNNELHLETDHQLLQDWVCATAVYPYVNWDATIAIGKALEKKYSKEGGLVNYTNLLLLSRIQWMKDGQMPDSLRIEMLKELSNDKEITARKAVTDLLEDIGDSIPEDAAIFEEYQLQKTTNNFLVRQYNEKGINWHDKDFVAVKEYLKNDRLDWATDIYLSDSKANTPIKQSKTDTRSIPIDDFIDKKEKEGKRQDEEKHKQFSNERRSLRWKTSGIIGSLVILVLLTLLFGFKIKPFIQPAKANRVIRINPADSMINLATDRIYVEVGNKEYKLDISGDSSISVKDLPTDTSLTGNITVVSNNTLIGQQSFRNTLNLGFENYNLALGEPAAKKQLVIYYSDDKEFSKIEGKLRTLLSDFAITTSVYNGVINDTGFFLDYSDSALKSRADLMVNQFKDISSIQLKPRFMSQQGASASLYLFFSVEPTSPSCEEASLPSGLNEIWKGGTSSRLINIDLDKQLIYYSTGNKNTYGTYRLREICANNDGIYRVITTANNQYKVFFIKDINRSAGFSLSVCQNLYPTIEEARKIQDASCDRFNTMSLYYENDPNKIFLPFGLNVLERRNQLKLKNIKDSLQRLQRNQTEYSIKGVLTYNSRFKWEIPDDLPIQVGQSVSMSNETPFDRSYIVYTITYKNNPEPNQQDPDCNRDFNSLKEALSVDPRIVCRLNLSDQNLRTLPDLSAFVNVKYIDVSNNYLNSKDSMQLLKWFPQARIIFYKQNALVIKEKWQLISKFLVDGKGRPELQAQVYLRNLFSIINTSPNVKLWIVVFNNEISGGEQNSRYIVKEILLYLENIKWNSLISSGRVKVEALASKAVINAAYTSGEANYFYIYAQGLAGGAGRTPAQTN